MLKELAICCALLASTYGYCANIYKLTQDNFEPSYRPEILRGLGIVIPIVGVIEGFTEFEKEKK